MIIRELDNSRIKDGKIRVVVEMELDYVNFRSIANARGFFTRYANQMVKMINNLAYVVNIKGHRPQTRDLPKTDAV